ncbi:MFS transporter [uncultured Microbacterium sp.]|uniref:MFS transporter n=1 Tax=uncultured Microbacterium sp. TaxID=191216 RepID=UPI0025EB846B|nr:MFS transporter [uncultured Microbacterium sp.]
MVYLPTLLFSLGEGAVVPLIPVIAASRGATLASAGLIASALVVGQLCGNIPAGWLVARLGERVTMVIAGAVSLLGVVATALAPGLALFSVAVFVVGMSAAAFGLARHAFMTTRVPLVFRARALSLLGGSFRAGMFVGPFVAAALLAVFHTENAALWFFSVCLVALIVLVLFGPDPEAQATAMDRDVHRDDVHSDDVHSDDGDREDSGEAVSGSIPVVERAGVFRTLWRYRGVLSRLGLSAASLSAVRSARQVVLPLWGVSIGLDASSIALVVGVSGAIDFALFYASGQVMDRFGRLWAALPAMVLMGAGFLVLSITHDVATNVLWFGMIAAVLGVGNGLSSGILLTLGADVAPQSEPAAFLGSWRTLTDAGGAVAPLIFSGVAALSSLAVGAAAMGAIGVLGAIGFIRYIPRFVPRRPAP